MRSSLSFPPRPRSIDLFFPRSSGMLPFASIDSHAFLHGELCSFFLCLSFFSNFFPICVDIPLVSALLGIFVSSVSGRVSPFPRLFLLLFLGPRDSSCPWCTSRSSPFHPQADGGRFLSCAFSLSITFLLFPHLKRAVFTCAPLSPRLSTPWDNRGSFPFSFLSLV